MPPLPELLPRRTFLQTLGGASLALLQPSQASTHRFEHAPTGPLIDTHQHLWNLHRIPWPWISPAPGIRLPWLASAPKPLQRSFSQRDYADALAGFPIRALYMEVDVDPADLDREAHSLRRVCTNPNSQTFAAILGGRPESDDFKTYIQNHASHGFVKGVRRVLHSASVPRGTCLKAPFIRGIRTLGKLGLTFDLCMRPAELDDAANLADACPDTQLILDHCGNGDAKAFLKNPRITPAVPAAVWQRGIDRLAKRQNVACKISGVVESMPEGWKTEHLAPVVNHCLDAFGPDRVVFGTNWPVCLLGASAADWIHALAEILESRTQQDRTKLWSENAKRIYRLNTPA